MLPDDCVVLPDVLEELPDEAAVVVALAGGRELTGCVEVEEAEDAVEEEEVTEEREGKSVGSGSLC